MNKETTFIIDVENFDEKGSGFSTLWRENANGNKKKLKLSVPTTLPGETVKVTVEQPDKRWQKGKLIEVINPHPGRTRPRCIHFGTCGGCVWQHWDYQHQLQQKTEEVKESLRKNGLDPNLVLDTIGMENPWNYRNKMEFTFSPEGFLGLHEQGNFRNIVPLKECHIAGQNMTQVALSIAKWAKEWNLSGYNKDKHEGLLRHLMVRESFATGEIMVALFATEAPSGNLENAVKELTNRITNEFPDVKSLLWMENRDWADRTQAEKVHVLSGRDFIYDELCGYRYRLWYNTFFQTNPPQAEKLVELAIEMGDPKKDERMIDLFCGVGTFSLPFAARVKELAGIEIVESSIESAKRNARENGLENTWFLARDARHGIDEVLSVFGNPDLLLLDPPRSGAGGKVMRKIGRSQPKRIVYVSCNHETFATDVKELIPFGYKLEKVQPVDLFPHTVHVECCALLIKK